MKDLRSLGAAQRGWFFNWGFWKFRVQAYLSFRDQLLAGMFTWE